MNPDIAQNVCQWFGPFGPVSEWVMTLINHVNHVNPSARDSIWIQDYHLPSYSVPSTRIPTERTWELVGLVESGSRSNR